MISLLLQTFLLLFFPVVYAVGGQPYFFWYSCSCCCHRCGWRRLCCCWHGVPTISGIPASLYCSYSMMTVAGVPSVVDSPSVPSVRTVAGLPHSCQCWPPCSCWLSPLLLAIPAVANFPAVAVVSAVNFSTVVGDPAESLLRFSTLPENQTHFSVKDFALSLLWSKFTKEQRRLCLSSLNFEELYGAKARIILLLWHVMQTQ